MYKDFSDLIEKNLKGSAKKKLAVVCAEDDHVLSAVMKAYNEGLVDPILIGDTAKIKALLPEDKCNGEIEIIDAPDIDSALAAFVKLAQEGKCQAVMKGHLDTKYIMKAIVSKENGLKTGDVISSLALYQIPHYHKLIGITDAAIVTYPDLEQKKGLLKNAIGALHKLGYENPKVAVLCAVEKVNPKMPETLDAEELTKMGEAGEFGNATVYGPLSYDLIVSSEAAAIKGVTSPVAGDADVILVPDICTGNALTKALGFTAKAPSAAIVLGAKIPVILTSRASSVDSKYRSIAAAVAFG